MSFWFSPCRLSSFSWPLRVLSCSTDSLTRHRIPPSLTLGPRRTVASWAKKVWKFIRDVLLLLVSVFHISLWNLHLHSLCLSSFFLFCIRPLSSCTVFFLSCNCFSFHFSLHAFFLAFSFYISFAVLLHPPFVLQYLFHWNLVLLQALFSRRSENLFVVFAVRSYVPHFIVYLFSLVLFFLTDSLISLWKND